MDFDFSDDQNLLRNLAREFLTEQAPVRHVRAMMEDERGFEPAIYRQCIGLGMLPFPERFGGAGLGMVEQAIVLEEMGRIPYPGPYFATTVLAGAALMESGDERAQARYLPSVCAGDRTMTLAFLEDAIGWTPEVVQATLAESNGGYTLNGVKRFVPFGHSVDTLLVAARLGAGSGTEGVTLVAVPRDAAGVGTEVTPMMDLTSKVATVTFDNVSVANEDVIGAPGGAWPALERTLQVAAVGASAEMLGAARRSLEMSVDYAKVRKQFGQFIGQFQAVKHKLAEMLELVENTHAAVYYAAWAQAAGAPDAAMAASVAKSTANEASRIVCGDAIQVHGGIGFTWEYDLHLYFKRAKHLEPLYGDTQFHREQVLVEALAGRVAGGSDAVAAD